MGFKRRTAVAVDARIWLTADGRTIRYQDLTNDHLVRIIEMLESDRASYLAGHLPGLRAELIKRWIRIYHRALVTSVGNLEEHEKYGRPKCSGCGYFGFERVKNILECRNCRHRTEISDETRESD